MTIQYILTVVRFEPSQNQYIKREFKGPSKFAKKYSPEESVDFLLGSSEMNEATVEHVIHSSNDYDKLRNFA